MTTPEPWVVGDVPTNVAHHETTTAELNADIGTLAALKDTLESAPVKGIFESVISVLTLVRVRLSIPFLLSHPLIGDTTRTG